MKWRISSQPEVAGDQSSSRRYAHQHEQPTLAGDNTERVPRAPAGRLFVFLIGTAYQRPPIGADAELNLKGCPPVCQSAWSASCECGEPITHPRYRRRHHHR